MILVGAGLVIVVVVLVGLALSLTSSRSLGCTTLLAIGGGALLLAVGGAVVVVGIGLGGGDDDAAPTAATETTTVEPTKRSRATTTTTTSATTTTTTANGGRARGALDAREVAMRADSAVAFGAPRSVVDRLPRRAVLLVTATGFAPNATGVIEQCTVTGCGNPFPVVFGEGGSARLQYLVDREIPTGPGERSSCGPADPSCVVRISSSGNAAYLATVFGGAAPPPAEVAVESRGRGIVDGQLVRVSVTGFRPGERVRAMLCAAPASHGSARCGAPGEVAPFTIDADGSGRTSLVIRRGPVGTERVACGRDIACGVVVSPERSFVPNPIFVVSFAAGPGAAYDNTRVLSGLLLAALLLIVAWLVARSTDWRKPTEADTPELDRAVL